MTFSSQRTAQRVRKCPELIIYVLNLALISLNLLRLLRKKNDVYILTVPLIRPQDKLIFSTEILKKKYQLHCWAVVAHAWPNTLCQKQAGLHSKF